MAFPAREQSIANAEKELGFRFPAGLRSRLVRDYRMDRQTQASLMQRPLAPAICAVVAIVVMLLPRKRYELRILDAIYISAAHDVLPLALLIHAVVVLVFTYFVFVAIRRITNGVTANVFTIITFVAYLLVYVNWGTFCC